jgi:hypothetical protein
VFDSFGGLMTLALDPGSQRRILQQTTSLCTTCKQGSRGSLKRTKNLPTQVLPRCGTKTFSSAPMPVVIAVSSITAVLKSPQFVKNEVKTGCPYDCGACPAINSRCIPSCPLRAPAISIASAYDPKPRCLSHALGGVFQNLGGDPSQRS